MRQGWSTGTAWSALSSKKHTSTTYAGGARQLTAFCVLARYDLGFDCPFQEFLQLKTGKLKRVPFIPGKTRHLDWYLDLADFLIGQRDRETYSFGEPAFLFPFLAKGSSNSGQKISNYLKDLLPGGSKTYSKVAVPELPPKVSAGASAQGRATSSSAPSPSSSPCSSPGTTATAQPPSSSTLIARCH